MRDHFDRCMPTQYVPQPHPHLVINPIVDPETYAALPFPDDLTLAGAAWGITASDAPYAQVLRDPGWRALHDQLSSESFVRSVLRSFSAEMKREGCLVDAEQARVVPFVESREQKDRPTLGDEAPPNDVFTRIDFQSKSAGGYRDFIHLDWPRRIVGGILFFSDAEEEGLEGGELAFYRDRDFRNDRWCHDPELVALFPAKANSGIIFLNSNRHQLVRRSDSMPDDVIVALNTHVAQPVRAAPSAGSLLSVRHPRLMSIPLRDQARLHATIADLIAAMNADGFGPVRILCHDARDAAFASTFTDVEYILSDDVYSHLDLLRSARLVVSFRLHAFLPCLSFGTPAINISYDERSRSLVRTIGLESWDIDLIRSADVVAEVRERCTRLPDLAELRAAAEPQWTHLTNTMREQMAEFAVLVHAYASQGPEQAR